jgi:hypothetical protein
MSVAVVMVYPDSATGELCLFLQRRSNQVMDITVLGPPSQLLLFNPRSPDSSLRSAIFFTISTVSFWRSVLLLRTSNGKRNSFGFGFDAVYAEPTIAVVAYVASDSFLKLPTVQLSWESAKVASFELTDTRLVEFLRSRTISGVGFNLAPAAG